MLVGKVVHEHYEDNINTSNTKISDLATANVDLCKLFIQDRESIVFMWLGQ